MKNFQDIIFIWIRTYRAIFNSALVYLYVDNYFRKKLISHMFDRVLNTPLFYKVMIIPRIFQQSQASKAFPNTVDTIFVSYGNSKNFWINRYYLLINMKKEKRSFIQLCAVVLQLYQIRLSFT